MRILLMFWISGMAFFAKAQSLDFNHKSRIYLVRHAEKQTGADPLLTTAGNERAGDLMRTLKEKHIRRIYVTQYKRTQNTGDSLRIQLGIDTVHYLADTSCIDLLNKIGINKDDKNTILIIGHSNTLPSIIRKLGVANYPIVDISDNEFDNLYMVSYKKGKARVTKSKYGAKSGASATMK